MKERLCWDCPERKGFSKFVGNIQITIAEIRADAKERVDAQRGSCKGRVPVKMLTSMHVYEDTDGAEVVEAYEAYGLVCSQHTEKTIDDVPLEVRIGCGLSRNGLFTRRIVNRVDSDNSAIEAQ